MECLRRTPLPVPSAFQQRQNPQPAPGRLPGLASRRGMTTFRECGFPGPVSAASIPPSRPLDNGRQPLTRLAAVGTATAATKLFLVQGKHTVWPCFFYTYNSTVYLSSCHYKEGEKIIYRIFANIIYVNK